MPANYNYHFMLIIADGGFTEYVPPMPTEEDLEELSLKLYEMERIKDNYLKQLELKKNNEISQKELNNEKWRLWYGLSYIKNYESNNYSVYNNKECLERIEEEILKRKFNLLKNIYKYHNKINRKFNYRYTNDFKEKLPECLKGYDIEELNGEI